MNRRVVRADPFFSETNQRVLRHAAEELEAGRGAVRELLPDDELVWADEAWKNSLYWQTQDRKILKRINDSIRDCERTPFHGK
jgi:hypothetical protein